MQIQNLNAWVDVARAKILGKYQLDEHDKTTYVLQTNHVDEGDYFSNRLHKDMDGILEDLRKAHVGILQADQATLLQVVRRRKTMVDTNYAKIGIEKECYIEAGERKK